MQLIYLRNSRFGTIVHSWLYLFGIPAFFGDYYNLDQGSNSDSLLWDYGLTLTNTSNNSLMAIVVNTSLEPEEKCFDSWGCFRPKYPELRGFYLFPDPLEDMNPSVCFYSGGDRGGCGRCQIVDAETIESLNPKPGGGGENGRSYYIVHGYMENGNRPWVKEMTCQLLATDRWANLFVLDWAEGAKPPYSQAVVNIELLAVYTAKIMADLEKLYHLKFEHVHIIGHSLGAHLGGFVGDWVLKNVNFTLGVGRISGLDPAQPHFQDLPSNARLDSGDASFVDIIHTDARPLLEGGNVGVGLGIQNAIGHADFFPNNGKEQPGCKDGVYNAILLEDGSFLYGGIRRFLGCDHMRAYEYFIESISSSSSCKFVGFACDSWDHFATRPRCIQAPTNRMGFFAVKPSQNVTMSYYLVTGSRAPFCRDHFIVTINLAQESSYRSTSDVHLVFIDGKRETTTLIIAWTELQGGNLTYAYLRDGQYTPPISRIILRPAMSNPLLRFVNRLGPKTPDLTVTSISIRHLEDINIQNVVLFCPEGSPSFSISDQNPQVTFVQSEQCGE